MVYTSSWLEVYIPKKLYKQILFDKYKLSASEHDFYYKHAKFDYKHESVLFAQIMEV